MKNYSDASKAEECIKPLLGEIKDVINDPNCHKLLPLEVISCFEHSKHGRISLSLILNEEMLHESHKPAFALILKVHIYNSYTQKWLIVDDKCKVASYIDNLDINLASVIAELPKYYMNLLDY